MAGVSELQRPAQACHLGQVIAAAVFDDLAELLVADEAGVFAADADVAVQCHVHPRPHGRAVDHGDGRLADERDVAVEVGEAVEEMLPGSVRPLLGAPVADKVVAGDRRVVVPAHIRP